MLQIILIHLSVRSDKDEKLELTENAPRDIMREFVMELKRSKRGGQLSQLMDARNYYEVDEPVKMIVEENIDMPAPSDEED